MATAILRPNATVTNNWTVTDGGATQAHEVTDDAVTQPTAPGTASDFIRTGSAQTAEVHVETVGISSVSQAKAWIYGSTALLGNFQVSLLKGSTVIAGPTNFGVNNPAQWISFTYTGALTQAEVDDLRIRVAWNGSAANNATVYAAYVELTYVGAPQTVSAAGDIATAEAHGTQKLNMAVAAAGALASAEAFGTDSVNLSLAAAGAIAGAEAFGTAAVMLAVQAAGEIASGEGLGSPVLTQVVLPTAIAGGEAFGTATLGQQLLPVAIAGGEAFGTASLVQALVDAGAIGSAEALGTPIVTLSIAPSAIAGAEAFGTAALHQLITAAGGIASAEAFGTAALVLLLQPSSIGSAEAFDAPNVRTPQFLYPTAIVSLEVFGDVMVVRGVTVAVAVGSAAARDIAAASDSPAMSVSATDTAVI